MKLNNKIIIDNLLGIVIVRTIVIIKIGMRLFQSRKNTLKTLPNTIVVSKYMGMGSIIQATPLLQTLKLNFPECTIYFLTTHIHEPLFHHISEVDHVISVTDQDFKSLVLSSAGVIKKLWKLKPDLYCDLEYYSNYGAIIASLSGAAFKIGFSREKKEYRKQIYNFIVPFNYGKPISETYLQFAAKVGCTNLEKKLKINLPAERRNGGWIENNVGPGQKYVLINPNASSLRKERRWPKKNYAELARYILTHHSDYTIVLIGDKEEQEYVKDIVASIPPHPKLLNSTGKLSLEELVRLIAGTSLMLTNDSGPMHIAFAFEIQAICLFGPCSPRQYGNGKNTVVIYKNVRCSPCVHIHWKPPCNGNNICMKEIEPQEVINALSAHLS